MPKKTYSTRKTVVFIVEGSSDKKALERIFKVIYKQKNITFEFTRGDITSSEETDKDSVCDLIYHKVFGYMKEKKLKKSDIWQIVQIFDMDGTYIPESAIVEGDTKELLYSVNQISCKNIQKVINRNSKKREVMDYLLSVDKIKDISYKTYYMSSNLDHALYDVQNLPQEDKEVNADAFYSEFMGKEKLFIDFLEDEVINGVPGSFFASWQYIKDGVHSLERHTNLNIYFRDNPYD